jgi:hypothetical protein
MLCVAFDAKRNLFHKNYLVGVKENRRWGIFPKKESVEKV